MKLLLIKLFNILQLLGPISYQILFNMLLNDGYAKCMYILIDIAEVLPVIYM